MTSGEPLPDATQMLVGGMYLIDGKKLVSKMYCTVGQYKELTGALEVRRYETRQRSTDSDTEFPDQR